MATRKGKAADRAKGAVAFKRHFLLPGVVITAAEVVLVVVPVFNLFPEQQRLATTELLRIAVPVFVGAAILWMAAITSWLAPLQRAIQSTRKGQRLERPLATAAYGVTWWFPVRALVLRTVLWGVCAGALGVFLWRGGHLAREQIVQLASVAMLHAFATNIVRGAWYAVILSRVRQRVFPGIGELRAFGDGYFARLILVALIVWGGAIAGISAFLNYFLPISLEQYLQVLTFYPVALVLGLLAWILVARRLCRHVEGYLRGRGAESGRTPNATLVYRRAQSLPYRLGLASLMMWTVIGLVSAWVGRARLRFEYDDTLLMLLTTLIVAVGAAIYEALWHRETMRPMLSHLTLEHRLPVRGIRPTLSLRSKLFLSFGGVVLFACGMALIWGFVQYKNLVADSVVKQADLGLKVVNEHVGRVAASGNARPTPSMVRETIDKIKLEGGAVFYYHSRQPKAQVKRAGGGTLGAPPLPWYVVLELEMYAASSIKISSFDLAGKYGPLIVRWNESTYDLGSIAVLYPTYRGRGPSVVRELKELLLFFLVLFAACGGIVLFTVTQFVDPIRRLEARADGMARGELAEPVTSGGEGDEVGRLTFALEEMRRALREKLRSTEEVNLDLERAVQRRTADLAKKNRELAETLDKLTRAQDQLVRSKKMASIGQLVAGIAHEINNPVNAIVNTVGPLEEAVSELDHAEPEARDEAAADIRDMVRVVQRGAARTKDIVQALNNYSRTDDESVVEFDLNRSIEDSLELLRHLLKKNIEVRRTYGDVGRIRGHAGQLNQVFMNLLNNAAQAVSGREGATIWIESHANDANVVISVRDNGPGIPADVLPRIFDPFFTTKDVGQGTGLGLSIVHGFVERHGGTIEVDSEIGQGTTFTVTLPAASAF